MAGKRKDTKGRVLKDGEYQRKNGSYVYRYKDEDNKKFVYIYAKTLDSLRAKERGIGLDLLCDLDFEGGSISVVELVEKYLSLKRKLKPRTLIEYQSVVHRLKNGPFGQKKVRTVKISDAKAWFVMLSDLGLKRATISNFKSVLQPAFNMAYEDDLIRKNPFAFNLSDLLPDDRAVRPALTADQQKRYLRFVWENSLRDYYYDIVILLETGLRVSELYGLTYKDVDLNKRRLYVKRQLYKDPKGQYHVTPPKSKSGIRTVPLTKAACKAFEEVLYFRPYTKIEMLIDGCSEFLFLDKFGLPKVALHLQNHMRMIYKKYSKIPGNDIPKITPHVLRHTFCTNLYQKGLDPKSLQYVMGHSTADITMQLYTHSDDYDFVEQSFRRVSNN